MNRWVWATMACLVAASAADAEFIILRVVMNRGPDEAGPGGPVSPGGPGRPGGMGGMLGGPGSPGPGMLGKGGGGPGGMTGGGPGGRPTGPGSPGPGAGMGGGMGGFTGRPTGPGGPGGPTGPGGPGGPTGPGGPGGRPTGPGAPGAPGGIPGLPGGFPGQPGAPGGTAPAAPAEYVLSPDDYVTVVVELKRTPQSWQIAEKPKSPNKTGFRGPDPKDDAGNFIRIKTEYGYTFINPEQSEIVIDYMGRDFKRDGAPDRFPSPIKQLERRREQMKSPTPEKFLELAEWCLSVGLPDEATKILDKMVAETAGDYKPGVKRVLEAYGKVRDLITANVTRMDKANSWKERLNYGAISVSKHYAIVHAEDQGIQESANRRLDYLEANFKTFYIWFALRERALPGPTEKLTALIVSAADDFRKYRDTFEATNIVSDGFHARRENLAVFAARRLDRASINFESLASNVYRHHPGPDLVKPGLPKQSDLKREAYVDHVRASTLHLVNEALKREAEIAAATHEGTKQLFGETGLLPRTVLAPEWVRFGTAALFDMPKGPFPGASEQLKVAMYPGGGGPHWAYMRYFEEMQAKGLLANPTKEFVSTVVDQYFIRAREAESAARSKEKKKVEEGDSRDTPAEVLYARARTLSWALVYFMAKEEFPKFEKFLQEIAKLPRDAELDATATITAFSKGFDVNTVDLSGDSLDVGRFVFIGKKWMDFMGRQQSPSRFMKLDGVNLKPGAGKPGGGFPAGGGPGAGGGPNEE